MGHLCGEVQREGGFFLWGDPSFLQRNSRHCTLGCSINLKGQLASCLETSKFLSHTCLTALRPFVLFVFTRIPTPCVLWSSESHRATSPALCNSPGSSGHHSLKANHLEATTHISPVVVFPSFSTLALLALESLENKREMKS
jgi:hypothetical protein